MYVVEGLYISVSLCERLTYESPFLAKPCHCSIICPVSASGKQSMSFRELLCFPFTVTDKEQMNQGLFLERQKKRKKENDYVFFILLRKGQEAGEKDNRKYIFCNLK